MLLDTMFVGKPWPASYIGTTWQTEIVTIAFTFRGWAQLIFNFDIAF
jgi:hypothetical protein